MKVTLLISGSIAAYKSAELVRALIKKGADVQVGMSQSASHFVTPLTLQTLSGKKVLSEMFDPIAEAEIGHIKIADEADVVLVAPATANVIAKAAAGIADDVIGTTLLATRAPVIIAPAMNVNMWNNSVTQENVAKLKTRGFEFIDPEEGELACGWKGEGRLAEIETIVNRVLERKSFDQHSSTQQVLDDTHIIVTAGPTREAIDPIRFISNRSSGKMGFAIAEIAAKKGACVSLVSGPTQLECPKGVELFRVDTAEEMKEALHILLEARTAKNKYLYMAAAVSDHRPKFKSPTKLKSFKSKDFSIDLVASPDILAETSEAKNSFEKISNSKLTIVGFAAETAESESELLELAKIKLQSKQVDFIIANNASDSFEKETNKVLIVDKSGNATRTEKASKDIIAKKIIEQTCQVV